MNKTAFRQHERIFKRALDKNTIEMDEKMQVEVGSGVVVFPKFPGLILMRKCIEPQLQQLIIENALKYWAKPPNLSNLDAHFVLPVEGLWNIDQQTLIPPRQFHDSKMNSDIDLYKIVGLETNDVKDDQEEKNGIKFIIDSPNALTNDILKNDPQTHALMNGAVLKNGAILKIDPPTDAMHKSNPVIAKKVLNRLRWLTLGYQYNWTAKEYFMDRIGMME